MKLAARFCVVSSAIVAIGTVHAENLVPNSSFEDVLDMPFSQPAGWTTGHSRCSSDFAHSGEWSLRISPSGYDGQLSAASIERIELDGLEGARFELSAYALHPSDDSIAGSGHLVRMELEFHDEDENRVYSTSTTFFDGTTDDPIPAEDVWHWRSTTRLTPPAGVDYAAVSLYIISDVSNIENGLVYFDDVVLKVVPNFGDINADGAIDSGDLALMLAAWGTCEVDPCPADISGDGVISSADLAILLSAWSNSDQR